MIRPLVFHLCLQIPVRAKSSLGPRLEQETGERCGAGWPSLNFVRMSLQGVHARLQAGTDDTKYMEI
jgi:hypothetical protein